MTISPSWFDFCHTTRIRSPGKGSLAGSSAKIGGLSELFSADSQYFTVAGNQVIGQEWPVGQTDTTSAGTIMLPGTFTSITFTASYTEAGVDGMYLQIGATVPEPTTLALLALGGILLSRRRLA